MSDAFFDEAWSYTPEQIRKILAIAKAHPPPPLTYTYDPTPDTLSDAEPGVTKGYVVVNNGIGPALVYDAAMLHDPDGTFAVQLNPDSVRECTIVDDTERTET